LLVARCHLELLVCLFHVPVHAIDVVVDAVEHGALIDDHCLQLLKYVCELDNALGDVLDLVLTLGNEGLVGVVAQALLLGLEQRRLREGAVGVRLLQRRVVVGVLDGRGGAEGRGEAAEVAQLWKGLGTTPTWDVCVCVWMYIYTSIYRRLTLQIGRLLLAEHGADLTDARGERDLEVLGHDGVALSHVALLLRVAHHGVDALDGLLAALEAARNVLSQVLNVALLALLDVLVVEARQHVLLVQLVELARLAGDVGQLLRDLVLHVEPARRQQVHLNHRVAVVVVGAR
jgi:hypothetical protein